MKLSWPLSDREAVVHYFELEYFQDDLIIVLTNSISDLESTDRSFDGFTNDKLSEEKKMVRIDMVGGFALQKVTPERSYFRTIASMDIKLDFVPPSLINFISRQLIGNGFRLYQKIVASVSKGDEDFSKALGDPIYSRIREALYSNNIPRGTPEPKDIKNDDARILPEEHLIKTMKVDVTEVDQKVIGNSHAPEFASLTDQQAFGEIEEEEIDDAHIHPNVHLIKTMQADDKDADQKVIGNGYATQALPEYAPVTDQEAFGEIEVEEIEESRHLEESVKIDRPLMDQIEGKCHVNHSRKFFISPAVGQALETLDKIISLVHSGGFNAQTRFQHGFTHKELPNENKVGKKDSSSSEDTGCSDVNNCIETSNNETVEKTSHALRNSFGTPESRHMDSNSYMREVNHNRIVPASPEQHLPDPCETYPIAKCSSEHGKTEAPFLDITVECNKPVSIVANGIHENGLNKKSKLKLQKKQGFCCWQFMSKRGMA